MHNARAYSVASATSPFARTVIPRRDPTPHDIEIEIFFCGICHSDLHQARNEWSAIPTVYPCVPGHDVAAYLNLLRREGNLTLVGVPDQPHVVPALGLIFGNKSLSGSMIGGIRSTQEMLDFCGEHGITSDVEVIPIQKLDEAYERLLKADVKYRFSIDLASL